MKVVEENFRQLLQEVLCLWRKQIFVFIDEDFAISNSYTLGCPPVRGGNPRALASGLSYVQVDKHGITILYQLH